LVVFPGNLRSRSFVEYEWTDAAGANYAYRIDQANPNGVGPVKPEAIRVSKDEN
jgi:hypothetical protein